MTSPLPVHLLSDDPNLRDALAAMLTGQGRFTLTSSPTRRSASILLVDGRQDAEGQLQQAGMRPEQPGRALLLLGGEPPEGATLPAAQAHLPWPCSSVSLLATLGRLESWLRQGQGSETETRLVLVVGGRGGVGKTLLCASLLALHSRHPHGDRVLYLDLSVPCLASQIVLDAAPRHGLADVLRLGPAADPMSVLKSACALGQLDPERAFYLPGSLITDLRTWREQELESGLLLLGRAFGLLLVELPPHAAQLACRLLPRADLLILLAPPDVPGLRQAAALLAEIRQLQPAEAKVLPVLNLGLPSRGIGAREAGLALGQGVLRLPYEAALQEAADRGLPLLPRLRPPWTDLQEALQRAA